LESSLWSVGILMAEGGGGQSGGWLSFVPMLVIVALFYFILIAPMRKKQKHLQAMIEQLKSGDKVVTNGGIYGTVVGVDERVVHLRIADGVKILIAKSAVAGLQTEPGEAGGKG
jgi:preprotein translocase subunit YajC